MEIRTFAEFWPHYVRAERFERDRRAGIARILDARAIAFVEKQTCDEIERVLHARHDDDLVCRAAHAARGVEIRGDGLA